MIVFEWEKVAGGYELSIMPEKGTDIHGSLQETLNVFLDAEADR